VTFYQIEVRAIYERYDVHAQKLARDIMQLPTRQVPSLTKLSTSSPPLRIRTAQIYHLSGNLIPPQVEQLTRQLLLDPVVQEAGSGRIEDAAATGHVVDVFFHPGVTDTLAESVITGARMLGITDLEAVETGRRYILDARLSETDASTIARALLYNPVIQRYALYKAGTSKQDTAPVAGKTARSEPTCIVSTIALTTMEDAQLLEVSRAGLLSLNLDEMRTIQRHYREQGREPTDVELETLAQTWSEHCSHKTFKATIEYREVDGQGKFWQARPFPGC